MIEKQYWSSLVPPLAPSHEDTLFFQDNLLLGTTLLLGCTPQIFHLSDVAMDIDPYRQHQKIIVGNWITNSTYYNNIIGDGCLNILSSSEVDSLLDMAKTYTSRLIIRSFSYKLPTMRIAFNFPKVSDFIYTPKEYVICDEYSFFVWDFDGN